jgi:hypothetical protein
MVVTTAAVLQGVSVVRAFFLLAPLAYAAAVMWSFYDLTRTPAEVILRGGLGAVRSVWEVARNRGRAPIPLAPVFHPRKADGALLVGFGDSVIAFRPEDWADFDVMRDALQAAADTLDAEGRTNGA